MELKIATRQWTDERELPHTYHYYLLIDHVSIGSFLCENYGLRVSEDGGETVTVPSVTASALKMDELMVALVDRQITPSNLAGFILDWL